eukprot:6418738-Pyramimonas_sp.AAC.1
MRGLACCPPRYGRVVGMFARAVGLITSYSAGRVAPRRLHHIDCITSLAPHRLHNTGCSTE